MTKEVLVSGPNGPSIRLQPDSGRSSASSVKSGPSSTRHSSNKSVNNKVSASPNKPVSASPTPGKVASNTASGDKTVSKHLSTFGQQQQSKPAEKPRSNVNARSSAASMKSTASLKSKGSMNNNRTTDKNSNYGKVRSETGGGSKFPLDKDVSSMASSAAITHLGQQKQQQKLTMASPILQPRHLSNVFRSAVQFELSRNFRSFIERAMNQHKIFSGIGIYPSIRNALKHRGWVEKPGPLVYSHSSRSTNDALHQTKGVENESDTAWMTRVLKDYPPNFIWVNRRDQINWKYLTNNQLINRFPSAWFTTKTGICACLQHMHWFSEAGISDTFFPRCYRLTLEEERQAFQDDFRLTACMSFLRYIVNTFHRRGPGALADVHSKITPLSVDFACRQIGTYIRTRRHEDIDWLLTPSFMTQHWDAFIQQYYAVVHEGKKLRFDGHSAVQAKVELARKAIRKVAPYWPQSQLDGELNLWICKPAAKSCGMGIVIKNNLENILNLLSHNNFRETNWVVQKYIERPLLIYKTKFDIRQWFLVTCWAPLTVWFYKDSYVRFCTRPFSLDNYHESIHLCNNAVQSRYQNAPHRDPGLPYDNMWHSNKFQWYLRFINKPDAWALIYAGMKQAIVGVLLASQESADIKPQRCSCYELFGADFMLTEDFKPWLIEINDRPALEPTTSVTTKMCSQVLEDIVKVVVDRKYNRKADTGSFELIYRQNANTFTGHEFSGHDITVFGKRLYRDPDWPVTISKSTPLRVSSKIMPTVPPVVSSGTLNNVSSPVISTQQPTFFEHIQKLRINMEK